MEKMIPVVTLTCLSSSLVCEVNIELFNVALPEQAPPPPPPPLLTVLNVSIQCLRLSLGFALLIQYRSAKPAMPLQANMAYLRPVRPAAIQSKRASLLGISPLFLFSCFPSFLLSLFTSPTPHFQPPRTVLAPTLFQNLAGR